MTKSTKRPEDTQQIALVNHLKEHYPGTIGVSNLAGVHLHPSIKAKIASMQTHTKQADLLVLEGRGGWFSLALELKRDHDSFLNKNGTFKKGHISQQVFTLQHLRGLGYYADMVTLDEAIATIEWYKSLQLTKLPNDLPLFDGRNIK